MITQALEDNSAPCKIDLAPFDLASLEAAVNAFLISRGTPELMGSPWQDNLTHTPPKDRLEALLEGCGFARDFKGFFDAVLEQLDQAQKAQKCACISFEGKSLPLLLVYYILELLQGGQTLWSVKNTRCLGRLTGMGVKNPDRIQKVLDTYPVRLSSHVIRQAMVSPAVAAQYLPFEDELDGLGHELTFDGHFKDGLMEQMYSNRAIFLLDMRCPVYCRFCFRKHKSLRREKSPCPADVSKAVEKVGKNKAIQEILITGGEPLLNMKNMETAIEGLMKIDHVQSLRIATRSLAYYPHLFLHHDKRLIRYLTEKQKACQAQGKQIEIGVHLVHPDEIAIQTLEIIAELTASGIPVYVQTPFLKELNHEGPVLGRLFTLLRMAGADIYYIFTPCHPIHGTRKYWSPISLSMKAYAWMRANLSDRCIPKLCTATPLGKMEWHTSGWAVEKDDQDRDHIWIRTPYTRSYFKKITGTDDLPVTARDNQENTLDVKCLIDMGDDALFLGGKGPGRAEGKKAGLESQNPVLLERAQAFLFERGCPQTPQNDTGIQALARVHKTKVVLTLDLDTPVSRDVAAYIRSRPPISDIVIWMPNTAQNSVETELSCLKSWISFLDKEIQRPLYFRIFWPRVQKNPDQVLWDHLNQIRTWIRFDPAAALKIELETWWFDPKEITQAHDRLFKACVSKGIPVYANTALIREVNTAPEILEALAHRIRAGGMRFHHVYTSGLVIQNRLNKGGDMTTDQVIAIASRIRKNCSGRQVPLYMVWTETGDSDFGL